MSTVSPNMGLLISTIGVDSGLSWEQNLNASLTTVDGHDHSPGKGVAIQPAGISITSALSFNNNAATNLSAATFVTQASPPANQSIYFSGVDLWAADGAGNHVQITSGGAINATSSGISSGTATASFVSSVLVVNAAANTPANIKGGSLLLGNNTAGTNYLTLAPPSAMAANYTLTLPSIPGSSSFLGVDTSGNISGIAAVSGGITGSNIASATITGSNIAVSTITASNISTVNSSSSIANYAFRVSNTAASSLTAGTINTLTWNTTEYNRGAMFVGSIQMTVPFTGLYRMTAYLQIANCQAGQQGFVTVWSQFNGQIARLCYGTLAVNGQSNNCLGSSTLSLTAGDNLFLRLQYLADGTNRALSGDSSANWWAMEFLGA